MSKACYDVGVAQLQTDMGLPDTDEGKRKAKRFM